MGRPLGSKMSLESKNKIGDAIRGRKKPQEVKNTKENLAKQLVSNTKMVGNLTFMGYT